MDPLLHPRVLYKRRGQLHEARALSPRAVERTHMLGLAWVEGLLAAALAAEARVPAWTSEDVLWIEPSLAEREPRVLATWLASGAVWAVDETRDADDRRELAPTVLIASAHYYEQLKQETTQRLQRNRVAWWLRTRAPFLIVRPLLDQLGLARVRLALTSEPLGAETRDWFAALGLPVSPLERTAREAAPAVLIEARV